MPEDMPLGAPITQIGREACREPIRKGQADPLGDDVKKVYVRTDHFCVYTVVEAANDFGRLRYCLAEDYEKANELRGRLAAIVGKIAIINDVVCGMRPMLPTRAPTWLRRHYDSLRERSLDVMAKAMQLAFDGFADRAVLLLAAVQAEVEYRRDSRNRMRYILANAVALTLILLFWLVVGDQPAPTSRVMQMLTGLIHLVEGDPGFV